MQNFYLIRHGETDWNVKLAKLQGHTDIPLNEKGLRQAHTLFDLTAPLRINKVISSDLQRAQQTAHCMTQSRGADEITRDLREVHLGIGEGLTWDEVTAKLGPEFRSLWSINQEVHMDLRFPEGESRREVVARIKKCLQHYLEKYPGETLAFVTHGYVIRTIVYHLSPLENNFFVPNCAIVPFAFNEGQFIYKGPQSTDELLQPRIAD